MKNFLCQPLDIVIDPLTTDIKGYGTNPHQFVPLSNINVELCYLVEAAGLYIAHAEIFYNRPFQTSIIHTDVQKGNYGKLNFIFGGSDSNMCWYKPKKEFENKPADNTRIQTKSIKFTRNEVDLIHEEEIFFPSIIQVGIPHNVVNNWQERWCLSFVLHNNKQQWVSFEEACQQLNKYSF